MKPPISVGKDFNRAPQALKNTEPFNFSRRRFSESVERRTKMKRTPTGSRSTGLFEGAFIPTIGEIRVEMPGGKQFVWVLKGKLVDKVTFDAKHFGPVAKFLKNHLGKIDTLETCVIEEILSIRCSSSKIMIIKK